MKLYPYGTSFTNAFTEKAFLTPGGRALRIQYNPERQIYSVELFTGGRFLKLYCDGFYSACEHWARIHAYDY